jgi:hypothetical protein
MLWQGTLMPELTEEIRYAFSKELPDCKGMVSLNAVQQKQANDIQ